MLPPSVPKLYIAQLQIFHLYIGATNGSTIWGYLALLLPSAPPASLPMKQSNRSDTAFEAKEELSSRPWSWSLSPCRGNPLFLVHAKSYFTCNCDNCESMLHKFWAESSKQRVILGQPCLLPRGVHRPTSSSAALGKLCRKPALWPLYLLTCSRTWGLSPASPRHTSHLGNPKSIKMLNRVEGNAGQLALALPAVQKQLNLRTLETQEHGNNIYNSVFFKPFWHMFSTGQLDSGEVQCHVSVARLRS